MLKNISEKIKQEIEELSILLSDSDPKKMARQIKASSARMLKLTSGADAWVDPVLLKIMQSKYSTVIVAVIIAALLGLGSLL